MRIPNGDRAVVDADKLRTYCLNPGHLRGRHKARVFASRLGLSAEDADRVRDALLQAARTSAAATLGDRDRFGQRYVLDLSVAGPRGVGTVRSHWIVRTGDDVPRLTTCYVR